MIIMLRYVLAREKENYVTGLSEIIAQFQLLFCMLLKLRAIHRMCPLNVAVVCLVQNVHAFKI